MKAFIFDPLWDDLVTEESVRALQESSIDLTVVKQIAPLRDCAALFEGFEDRIVCINPDYVGWDLKADGYKNIPGLKAILVEATSFSWIDTSYATKHNIPVCNIKGFSSGAVADWAILIMLNLARKIPELIKDGFPLDFDKDYMKYRGIEMGDKTAGIIGLGNIGTAIAERCAGLGMKVVYWSQNTKTNQYSRTELQELFASADVIFPTMAVNEQSKKVITTPLLDTMKQTAILVDIVEHLHNHEHVLNMVTSRRLFGYGFEAPPNSFGSYTGNVWAAPAYGWVTDRSMIATVEHTVQNIINATEGKYPNRIN